MAEITLDMLWNQFHTRLHRFVSSRITSEDDAEDIVQDVFLRVHTNLENVQHLEKLEGWMYQIARNAIIDHYRRPIHEELIDFAVEDEYPEKDAPASLAPYLREIVESLPEPYREALLLTNYQGLSQKDLADRLGISYSGAKSRVQRARQKVKEVMLTCCHYEFDVRGLVCCYRERCCGCLGQSIPL
jgi:RNA polymerase sigma-70 factor (ECF subfamily)